MMLIKCCQMILALKQEKNIYLILKTVVFGIAGFSKILLSSLCLSIFSQIFSIFYKKTN